LSDLVAPVRSDAGFPVPPLPEYVPGGNLQPGPLTGGRHYSGQPQAAYPQSFDQPYSAGVVPDQGYQGYYQPQVYEITAGVPAAAPYYEPPPASSSWTLGDDFR
jgi:hypothetical protein